MKIRTYSELIALPTFEERVDYLKLNGVVCDRTFGFDRIFNQMFYTSTEWRTLRNHIILRDLGCDLASKDHEIPNGVKIMIHHMNPISINDIRDATEFLMNPEYLITTTHDTHQAIHYGSELRNNQPIIRTPNDTCPWRR